VQATFERTRALTTGIAASVGLIAALTGCASPAPGATTRASTATFAPTATTPQATATTEAVATVVPTPIPTESPAELGLPDDVTLEWIGDFEPVTGLAHFNQLTEDSFSISIDVETSSEGAAQGFAVLLLSGTCADQSEPADFQGALFTESFGPGDTPAFAFVVSRDELEGILTSAHSILVTDAPGLHNLACGDIEV
jgi:hypothetical protein